MPEPANPPLSDAEIQAIAARLEYSINVVPQPSRVSVGDNEIIEAEGAWQWNVKRRGRNLITGHSCGSPGLAFDRALLALRKDLSELASQTAGATGGDFTLTDAARAAATQGYTFASGYASVDLQLANEWVGLIPGGSLNLIQSHLLDTHHGTTYAETSREF